MSSEESQNEELEVLLSIYNSDWIKEQNVPNTYSMRIDGSTKLFITLNNEYPTNSPPSYELLAPYLSAQKKEIVQREFQNIFIDNIGEPILYQWIEKLKEIISDDSVLVSEPNCVEPIETSANVKIDRSFADKFDITTGPVIQDRKSVFQGHACKVENLEEVKLVMSILMENKKIAQATHNMLAYRIKQDKYLLKDCDDDGEAKAGSNLLELLEILNVTNVMVVVSRWYGGIHLGPDRFRHIKNAARQVLDQAGFISNK